ncbi:MAG TPA: Stp1/IreP family PP2C-type Ser/Thr phosphatase [Cellulomonadaceae bacterium]|nr:Stp1/IreP family PP2C-type Ser/Thr phosphatase [Cellulomonadaceae bacterium]
MSIALRYAARSDIGLVRSNNQDSAYAGPHLLMVADGMGGHAGGDVASSIAVAALAPLDDEAHGPDDALDELDAALHAAQDELLARAKADADLGGMGTTVTALLRAGNKLVMAHIGDSRAYLLRDGELNQVTIDHTFVQHLVNTGKITLEEAAHHPQRSVVMRVLGDFDMEIVPDLSVREARPGDRWLLCSDGLSGVVSAETIAETMDSLTDLDACADRLVQLALRGGGPDNVTVIVADILDLDDLPDGAAPTTAATVVGSAALSRNVPTSAADGPAARAASLARSASEPTTPDDASDDDAPRPRRRRIRALLVTLLVLVVLGGAGFAGYRWTQTQYYVGVSDGTVAIYRGIDQSLGPVHLSRIVEESGLPVSSLAPFVQDRLAQGIEASSLADARSRVQIIRTEAATSGLVTVPSVSPSASTGLSASPSAGAGASG